MSLQSPKLLPYPFKKIAWITLPTGVLAMYSYFQDYKPEWLNVKVFAIASTYLDNRYFEVVKTNLMDEIGVFLILLGLFVLVFSREKNDFVNDSENRISAFLMAAKLCMILWLLSYFLFFGYIILPISISIFPAFLIIYYLIFRYLRSKNINDSL